MATFNGTTDGESVLIKLSELLLFDDNSVGTRVLEGRAKLTLPVSVLQALNGALQNSDSSTQGTSEQTRHTQSAANEAYTKSVAYLQEFISRTPKLKLTRSIRSSPPDEVDIMRFINLRYLELDHINMSIVKGLQALRPQLELIRCTASTKDFENILAGDPNSSLQVWEELRTIDLSRNEIESLGLRTFMSTPWLQYLDLSYNGLTEIEGCLAHLNNLKCLNLSYNFLESLPLLSRESNQKLQTLLLSHNCIEDIRGLWVFVNINKLDLSNNLLEDHLVINSLVELDHLNWLNLAGNPLSYHRYHRTYTCACLSKNVPVHSIMLDGKPLNTNEKKVVGTRNNGIGRNGQPRFRATSPQQQFLHAATTSDSNDNDDYNNKYNSQSSLLRSGDMTVGKDKQKVETATTTSLKVSLSAVSSYASPSIHKTSKKIREAIIVDADDVNASTSAAAKLADKESAKQGNMEHLETKKQVEVLRERFGEEHWLHSHAGSFVQDLLGFQKAAAPTRPLHLVESGEDLTVGDTSSIDEISKGNINSSLLSNELDSDQMYNLMSTSPLKSAMTTDDDKSFQQSKLKYTGKNIDKTEMRSDDDDNNYNIQNQLKNLSDTEKLDNLQNSGDNIGTDDTNVIGDSNQNIVSNVEGENIYPQNNEENNSDADDEDDEYNSVLYTWLVEKKLTSKLEQIFLVLKEKEILEKHALRGDTLVRWSLSSLQSCAKVNAQPPIVQLTFDTIRRNCQQRTYVMELPDSQVLLQKLGDVLESRSLSAMNQTLFKCMQCSSVFSREVKTTVIKVESSLSCEVCGSPLVVKLDENDDESEHILSINYNVNNINNDVNQSNLMGNNNENINNNNNTTVAYISNNNNISNDMDVTVSPASSVFTSTAIVTNFQPKLSASPSQCSIGSAASLDQSSSRESPATDPSQSGMPQGGGVNPTPGIGGSSSGVRCADSDIEIISNPSQSSIEVIEVQARLQAGSGTSTPSRKRSSEERQMLIAQPPNLITVPESLSSSSNKFSSGSTTDTNSITILTNEAPNIISDNNDINKTSATVAGVTTIVTTAVSSVNAVLLTESSSSGSLTDSVCTAYENHAPSLLTHNNNSSLNVNSGHHKSHPGTPQPSGGTTFNSSNVVLSQLSSSSQKLQQEVQPDKSVSATSSDIDQQSKSSDTRKMSLEVTIGVDVYNDSNVDEMVTYDYVNYTNVDHRIKLYLYQNLFKHDDEQLTLLIRGDILTVEKEITIYFPGCFVISSKYCYLLKVINEEIGEDANSFLEKVLSVKLTKLKLSRLSWDQGIIFVMNNTRYLLLLQDNKRTNNFFKFVNYGKDKSFVIQDYRLVKDEKNECGDVVDSPSQEGSQEHAVSLSYVNKDCYLNLKNALSADKRIKDSNCIYVVLVTTNTVVKRDNEEDVCLPLSCIANTDSDLFLLTPDLRWLLYDYGNASDTTTSNASVVASTAEPVPQISRVQSITNLVDVVIGMTGCELSLHFLDEEAGIEECWVLNFLTCTSKDDVLESIRKPWEAVFSVPLQVTINDNTATITSTTFSHDHHID